jgi:Cytochrome P460
VTKWSKLDTTWQGVTFDDLLEAVGLAKRSGSRCRRQGKSARACRLSDRLSDAGQLAVAKDDGPGSKEMHVVYASPGTIAAYRKDGHFPDGTVLVKEVFKTTTKDMTTGTVSSAGTLAGWFVMVKDNVGRFSGNKLWGDGWGWSWFDATNPQKTTSTDYTTDCQSCHVPARQSDWIYTHGYPVLTR